MNKQKLYSLLHQAYELEFSGNYKQADILDNMIRTSAVFNAAAFIESIIKAAELSEKELQILNSIPEERLKLISEEGKNIGEVLRVVREEASSASKSKAALEAVKNFGQQFGEKARGVGGRVKPAVSGILQKLSSLFVKIQNFESRVRQIEEVLASSEEKINLFSASEKELKQFFKGKPRKNPLFKGFLEFRRILEDIKSSARGLEPEAKKLKITEAIENSKAPFDKVWLQGVMEGGAFTFEDFAKAYRPKSPTRLTKVLIGLAIAGGGGLAISKATGGFGGEQAVVENNETSSPQTPATDATDVQPAAPEEDSQTAYRRRQFLKQDKSQTALNFLRNIIKDNTINADTPIGKVYEYVLYRVNKRAANSFITRLRAASDNGEIPNKDYSSRLNKIGPEGISWIMKNSRSL